MSTVPAAHPASEKVATNVRDQPDGIATACRSIDHRGRVVIVHARGEVDAYSLPTWRQVTREACAHASPPGPVIVDITGLDFIACCALAAPVDQADVCRAHGINIIVVSRAPIVHRVTAATGLGARLPICASTEEAFLVDHTRCAGG